MTIDGVKLRKDKTFGSYFGTTEPEPYSIGKNHFVPKYRYIYISSEMYPKTDKNFVYITSNIVGSMRLYRHKNWFDTNIANIFASGKTLSEAVVNFEVKFKAKEYNNAS